MNKNIVITFTNFNNICSGCKMNYIPDLKDLLGEIIYNPQKLLLPNLKEYLKQQRKSPTIWMVLALMLFSLGFSFVYGAWFTRNEITNKIQEFSQNSFSATHVPRLINTRPGIITSLLASINQFDPFQESLPKTIDSLLNNVDLSYQKNNVFIQIDSIKIVSSETKIFSADNKPATQSIIIYSPHSNTLIPSSEHSYIPKEKTTNNLIPLSNLGDPEDKRSGYKRIERYSIQQVVDYFAPFLQNSPSHKDALSTALTLHRETFPVLEGIAQVYFISPFGIFSHRVPKDEPGLALLTVAEKIPLYRWEAAPYFQAYLKKGETKLFKEISSISPHTIDSRIRFHVTKAYLDLAGLGIVRTYSRSMLDKNNKSNGVFCVDLQLEIEELLKNVKSLNVEDRKGSLFKIADYYLKWTNNVFEYHLWKWTKEKNYLRGSELYDKQIEAFDEEGQIKIKEIKQLNFKRSDVKGIQDYLLDGEKVYIVPLRIAKDEQDILLIKPSGYQKLPDLLLIAGGISCFCAMLLLIVASNLTGKFNERARTATLLRNLPIGVLQVHYEDKREFIAYANDYAEQVFGRILPKFGEEEKTNKIEYQDVVYPRVVPITKNTQTSIRTVSLEDIKSIRAQGATSSYFAKVNRVPFEEKGPQVWVKVIGSPITQVDQSAEIQKTFGVFIIVEDLELIKDLEKVISLNREG